MDKDFKWLAGLGVLLAVVIGAAFSRPAPGPAPEPTPIIEPEPDGSFERSEPIPPVERPALTIAASKAFADQGAAYARNLREAGRKWRAKEFASPEAAHDWLKARNLPDHKDAYRPFNLLLDDNVERLDQAFDEAAEGFDQK